jgi:O-antigen/teichoic acid export membrane protein
VLLVIPIVTPDQVQARDWRFLRLWRSAFVRGVATLAGGQGLAIAIPILAAPVLGRLYTPSDYGFLGTYIGIASIFGTIGHLQYAQAIVVQRTERRALGLLAVSILASLVTAVLSCFTVVGLIDLLASHAALRPIQPWLWSVPLVTLAVGISGGFASLANRRRDYRFMSFVNVGSVIVGTGIALVFGYAGASAAGLLAGYVSGQLIMLVMYVWRYFGTCLAVPRIKGAEMLALARRQASFPLYSLPANVFRSIALAVPNFAIPYMGAMDVAGQFSRAQSLLALPINLIAMALAQVFQEKAARERSRTGSSWVSYNRLLAALMVASPAMFVVIALAAPWLFVIYLGPQWEDTGYIAQLLAPMMCLRMIAGPLWPVFAIYDANRQDFWIALSQFLATLLLTVAVGALAFPALYQVVVYGCVNAAISIVHIMQTYQLVRRDRQAAIR